MVRVHPGKTNGADGGLSPTFFNVATSEIPVWILARKKLAGKKFTFRC
jgi:hypothetical protein